jgi:hypothetical protein
VFGVLSLSTRTTKHKNYLAVLKAANASKNGIAFGDAVFLCR